MRSKCILEKRDSKSKHKTGCTDRASKCCKRTIKNYSLHDADSWEAAQVFVLFPLFRQSRSCRCCFPNHISNSYHCCRSKPRSSRPRCNLPNCCSPATSPMAAGAAVVVEECPPSLKWAEMLSSAARPGGGLMNGCSLGMTFGYERSSFPDETDATGTRDCC